MSPLNPGSKHEQATCVAREPLEQAIKQLTASVATKAFRDNLFFSHKQTLMCKNES